MKLISGSPADGVPAPKFERSKEFIIALNNIGRMLFCSEDDGRSEKDCMWEEY